MNAAANCMKSLCLKYSFHVSLITCFAACFPRDSFKTTLSFIQL